MDEFEKIRQVVETNSRLNSLHIRELGAELRAELRGTREQTRSLAEETKEMSAQLREVVKHAKVIGDRTDLRLELEDLKRRVTALEEQAS